MQGKTKMTWNHKATKRLAIAIGKRAILPILHTPPSTHPHPDQYPVVQLVV